MTQDVVIVGGARTPMAEYSGTPGYGKLKKISAIDLAAHSSKAALERAKVDPESVDHTVIGNALQTSNDAIYGARHVALKAGVPTVSPRSRSTDCAAPASSPSSARRSSSSSARRTPSSPAAWRT